MYDMMLVRYGEIGLKGKNRADFENKLVQNIKIALRDLGERKASKSYGRVYVELKGSQEDAKEVADRLSKVFGIVSISPTVVAPLDLEEIKKVSFKVMQESFSPPMSFKVNCKRSLKSFPQNSMEINRIIGAFILEYFEKLSVDVKKPNIELNVEIREKGAFVFSKVIEGPGGLPSGVTGKGVLLLSGGIDSPIAGYMAMKRGIEVIALHYTSPPFTSERSLEKVKDLARIISKHGSRLKLYINYFTPIQKAIQENINERMRVTVMRRFMFRIAEEIARKEKALTLVSGESVGQVASQTLESIQAIDEVVNIPVVRPVACLDKQEIVNLSKEIGTFDISTRPYEDCCTLFLPQNPETKPNSRALEREESKLDVENLIYDSIREMEIEEYIPYEEEKIKFEL